MQDFALVIIQGGQILIREADLRTSGIRLAPSAPASDVGGERYIDLQAMGGLHANLESDGTTLALAVAPQRFNKTAFGVAQNVAPRSSIVPAQFLDYDLAVTEWNGETKLTGLIDAGLSGKWGVVESNALVQSETRGLIRLETFFRRDFPDNRLRLTVGDALSAGAPWSQPMHFAGISFGTDFGLDPQSIFYPLPTVSGSARLPSTVELLANSSRQQLNVMPGNFQLAMRPQISGAGQVTMTVTDVTGAQQQIVRNFYASTHLLRPKLDEFNIEAGALRRNFGTSSFSYGQAFAAAGWRRGLTSTLTTQLRAEASESGAMAGAGASFLIAPVAEFAVSGAVSQAYGHNGRLWHVQGQRITPDYSFSASYEDASAYFSQPDGRHIITPTQRSELAVSGSINLGRGGNLGAGYIRSRLVAVGGGANTLEIASISYSTRLLKGNFSLGLQAFRPTQRAGFFDNIAVMASFTVALGPSSYFAANADTDRFAAVYEHRAPDAGGLQYRALAGGERGQGWYEGGLGLKTRLGDFRFDAMQRSGIASWRANARGSLLRIGATATAAPSLGNAFGKVEVDSPGGARIYLENRAVPRQQGKGNISIVTGLQPYTTNRIAVDPADLPIDENLAAAEQAVVPGWKQAVAVRFGNTSQHAATVRLHFADKAPVPAGAQAFWANTSGVVGHAGEVWIDDLRANTLLVATTPDYSCMARLPDWAAIAQRRNAIDLLCNPFIKAEPVL